MKPNWLAGIVFFALFIGAASAQPAADRMLDELMQKSGLWKQLAQIEPQMMFGAEQTQSGKTKLPEADFARLKASISRSYAADRLRADMRKQLALELLPADQSAALQWLTSNLGTRITALEEQSGELAEIRQREKEAGKLAAGLAPARRNRIEALVRAMRVAESGASIIINTTLGVANGFAVAAPAGASSGLAALRAKLEAQRRRLVESLEVRMVTECAFIYRSLSDEEIAQYIAFADSPSGRNYHAATVGALDKVMTDASLNVGFELAGQRFGRES